MLLSAVHDVGGFPALVVLRGVCAAAVGLSIYASCRSKRASARTACAVTVIAYIVAMPYLALRPQMLGAVLFAACVLVLAVRQRHPWAMWAIPFITALWVNLHGSFVLAVAVVAFAMLEDVVQRRPTWKTTIAVAGATIAATLLSPFGTNVWAYVSSLATDPIIRNAVEEWRPPTIDTLGGALFMSAIVALGGILARRGRVLSWLDLAWLVGFSLLALSAQRNVLWWIVAVMPLVASMIPGRSSASETPRGARIMNGAILSVLGVALVAALPWVGPRRPIVSGMPPAPLVAAADRQLPAGARVFVYQPWASWVEFASPDVRVFVDSRIEIFPESVWQEYQTAAAGGHDYHKVLDSWGVDAVMLPTDGSSLVGALAEDPAWILAYEDERGLLFIRDLATSTSPVPA
ncbi:MAG TPA: hypothetical protein VFI59_07815 [Actinomycetota bacterium]|nr:hypothetical protein [Actinomycetota bacterium]